MLTFFLFISVYISAIPALAQDPCQLVAGCLQSVGCDLSQEPAESSVIYLSPWDECPIYVRVWITTCDLDQDGMHDTVICNMLWTFDSSGPRCSTLVDSVEGGPQGEFNAAFLERMYARVYEEVIRKLMMEDANVNERRYLAYRSMCRAFIPYSCIIRTRRGDGTTIILDGQGYMRFDCSQQACCLRIYKAIKDRWGRIRVVVEGVISHPNTECVGNREIHYVELPSLPEGCRYDVRYDDDGFIIYPSTHCQNDCTVE